MNNMNKTILISGGVTGIGAATALKFLEDRWQVSVFSNSKEHGRQFAKLAATRGFQKNLLVMEADITREAEIKKVVARTKKKFKTIDVLINNAGFGIFFEAEDVDLKKYRRMLDVNLVGMAVCTKLVIPVMKKQGFGQIINMASIKGRMAGERDEFYSASKFGVMGYSEGLRKELQEFGIKVATVCPGMVKTNFLNKKEYKFREEKVWKGKEPVMMLPEDIGRAISFICQQSANCEIQDITIVPFAAKKKN